MRKVLLELPWSGVAISSFSVALVLACFAALRITAWRARREGLTVSTVYDLALWLISGGFIGARLLYLAVHPETLQGPLDVFKVWQGGIVFYGCILGGLIGSCVFWARHPFPFLAMADAVAPALCLGSAIGRIGCYLNGCCFGSRCDLPWAVRFPADSAPWAAHVQRTWISLTAGQSLPIHPTQLYAAINGFLLLGLLTLFYPRRRRDGEVFALAMLTFPVARFIEESLRDDEGTLLLGMTLSQLISVVIFGVGLLLWSYLSRLEFGRHRDLVIETPRSSAVPPHHLGKARRPKFAPITDDRDADDPLA